MLERFAERRGEAPSLDSLLDRLALLFAGNAVACQRTGGLQGRVLGEVHDIKR